MRINSTKLIILFLLAVCGHMLNAQDAVRLLGKMDNVMNAANDKEAKVKIILLNKSGKEKVREAELFQKGIDKRIYRYTFPESQQGIATLSLPGGIMWLYMPAFGKPKKISLLSKSQAFTGTDFSYEDMEAKPWSERFTPAYLETKNGNYILELKPISDKSDYSKIILTINSRYFYPVSMQYFDKKGEQRKEATYSYAKSGNYWYASEVVMKNLKKGSSTRILMSEVKFNTGLSDEMFTVEKLMINE